MRDLIDFLYCIVLTWSIDALFAHKKLPGTGVRRSSHQHCPRHVRSPLQPYQVRHEQGQHQVRTLTARAARSLSLVLLSYRSAATVFSHRKPGQGDFRVWNAQLISYAGNSSKVFIELLYFWNAQ